MHPNTDGLFKLSFFLYAEDGSSSGQFTVTDIGAVGQTKNFNIPYDNTGTSISTVIKAVTFASLAQDIATARDLNLIAKRSVAKFLIRLLSRAERSADRGLWKLAALRLYVMHWVLKFDAGRSVDADTAEALMESILTLADSLIAQ